MKSEIRLNKMGRFSQPTLAFYLRSKREKVLTQSLNDAIGSSSIRPTTTNQDIGAWMTGAMETKRHFLKSLTSSKATNAIKAILKRGFVDLPLVGPAIGFQGQGVVSPYTEVLQSEPIKAWIEGYWKSHGFSCAWHHDVSMPDMVRMDWPRTQTYIVQGPPTPIWILRIVW